MATMQDIFLLLLLLFGFGTGIASARVFTFKNNCSHRIWPGTLANGGPALGGGGFELLPGASIQLTAPAGWSGRVWARTGCRFDASRDGRCRTGGCDALKCTSPGAIPASLVEFTLGFDNSHLDFYDVSLVDGYNVGIGIHPMGGSGLCQYAGCVSDLNAICPKELQVKKARAVVACNSACSAFKKPEYCCTGDYSMPETCPPSEYSKVFKKACPSAYSYAYDDPSSTCTCKSAEYLITFCPTGL